MLLTFIFKNDDCFGFVTPQWVRIDFVGQLTLAKDTKNFDI